MGHEKRDCIALIGLVIVGLQRVFVLLYLLPFEVRGDGKHVGRYRHNRLPLASVVVYHREHTVPRGWRQNSSFSSLSQIFRLLLKISVEGNLRVNCIFGASAHSSATMECQKQR